MTFIQKKYPRITIKGCQVKSLEKAKLLCQCLDTMEKEFGIGSVEIRFVDCFICPDIDLTELSNSQEPMERLIGRMFIQLDKKLYGKESNYREVKRKAT